MDNKKINFCLGVYAKKVNTQYGELINLEIDVNYIKRNLTRENSRGCDVVYATIKTGKDGNPYVVMNEYMYNKKDDDTPKF